MIILDEPQCPSIRKGSAMIVAARFDKFSGTKTGKVIIAILMIAIIFSMITLLSAVAPYTSVNRIRSELRDRGYETDNIDFDYVGEETTNTGINSMYIYESSYPIIYEGVPVDTWEYYHSQFGTSGIWSYTHLEPYSVKYPDFHEPVQINLNISLSEEELAAIEQQAGDLTVEEYIKQLIEKDAA